MLDWVEPASNLIWKQLKIKNIEALCSQCDREFDENDLAAASVVATSRANFSVVADKISSRRSFAVGKEIETSIAKIQKKLAREIGNDKAERTMAAAIGFVNCRMLVNIIVMRSVTKEIERIIEEEDEKDRRKKIGARQP